ncbi:prostate and testis expressed protein 1 isoform X3 [Equus caballus]|uniref:prostate and testis expressed protein 1 isoform X3 n=1 Tax=Equus caballus TaxID=9796 RepID=UPI0038B2943E
MDKSLLLGLPILLCCFRVPSGSFSDSEHVVQSMKYLLMKIVILKLFSVGCATSSFQERSVPEAEEYVLHSLKSLAQLGGFSNVMVLPG